MSNKKSIFDLSDVDPTNEIIKNLRKKNNKGSRKCYHPFKHRILNEKGSVCTVCGKVVESPEKINQMIKESDEFASRLSRFREDYSKLREQAIKVDKLRPTRHKKD